MTRRAKRMSACKRAVSSAPGTWPVPLTGRCRRARALKGGTAINLFVQDMPRLSVDLDVYARLL
jgi:hypothetical protein